MINAISFVYPGVSRAAVNNGPDDKATKALDRKISDLSAKMLKVLCRTSDESKYDSLYRLLTSVTFKEALHWMKNNKIKFAPEVFSTMSDENLALMVLTVASLPKKIYDGMELYLYCANDKSVAHYDRLSKKLGFNKAAGLRGYMAKEWDDMAAQFPIAIPDNRFVGTLAHELSHRWEDRFDCSEFYRINWGRRGIVGGIVGALLMDAPIYNRGDEWDFADSFKGQKQNCYEDMASVVEEMLVQSDRLVKKAVENLMERFDRDLADKIFFCYRFYERVNDPDSWIVRTNTGGYLYRSEGKTWSIDINSEGTYDRTLAYGCYDPNAMISKAMKLSPESLLPTE